MSYLEGSRRANTEETCFSYGKGQLRIVKFLAEPYQKSNFRSRALLDHKGQYRNRVRPMVGAQIVPGNKAHWQSPYAAALARSPQHFAAQDDWFIALPISIPNV